MAVVVLVTSVAIAGGPTHADGSTYVVTTVDDPVTSAGRADARPGDGVCNIFADFTGNGSGEADPVRCTLRAAMEEPTGTRVTTASSSRSPAPASDGSNRWSHCRR
jgi:hypothetical protein